jgi:mono/diheme cytochrome c family protein
MQKERVPETAQPYGTRVVPCVKPANCLRQVRYLFLLFLLTLFFSSCGKESDRSADTATKGDPARGRQIYAANCVTCHNMDPSKDGSIGPAIKGASQDLLEAKIFRATYPPGYIPKRKTNAMPAQPYLKSAIPDLAAYLR